MKWVTWFVDLVMPKELSSDQLSGLTASQINGFKIRQISVLAYLLMVTQPFSIFIALLLNFLFIDVVSDTVVDVLTASIFVCSLSWMFWSYFFWINKKIKIPSPNTFYINYFFTALAAFLLGSLCAYFFSYANYDQRLMITAIYTGMICGGAFVLNTLPMAAFIWVLVISVMAIQSIFQIETPNVPESLAILMTLYAALILTVVMLLYRMYLTRLKAESETESEKKNVEKQKEMVDLLLKDFDDHVNDWLWELDKEEKIINLSPKLQDILLLKDLKSSGIDMPELFRLEFNAAHLGQANKMSEFTEKLATRQPFSDFIVPAKINDETCWLALTAKPQFDELAEFSGWRGFCSDVTVDYLHKIEIERLANYDSLTALPNRYYFSEFVKTLQGVSRPFAILIIDLDNFKEINDKFGHAEGDLVLKMLAERFTQVVKPGDLLARLGGDEFIYLHFFDENAEAAIHSLLGTLKEPFQLSKACVDIKASIGISLSPDDGNTEKALFGKADLAMYTAKKQRGNSYVFFDKTIEQLNQNRNNMIDGLKSAIANNELSLVFQPQVDLSENKILGFEALLRWNSPELGLISPVEFIPLAEEVGEILYIGEWVLHQACLEAVKWPEHISVAVNVSGLQFIAEDFINIVLSALTESGLSPARLELEVTESAIIKDMEVVNQKLMLLQDMNINVALDDFGTGFSSLSYLQRLSIDTLKIDRAFVTGLESLGDEFNSKAIINIIVQLSKVLNLNILVEGVETQGQLKIVRELGCHNIQGYLISRPLTADNAASFIIDYR